MSFPVKTEKTAYFDIDAICLNFGYNYTPRNGSIILDNSATPVSYNNNPAVNSGLTTAFIWGVTPTRCMKLNRLTIKPSENIYVQLQIENDLNSPLTCYQRVYIPKDTYYTFQWQNTFLRENDQLRMQLVADPATPPPAAPLLVKLIGEGPVGVDLPGDFNYLAEKREVIISDSIGYGGAIPYRSYNGDDLYTNKTRNYFRAKGQDVQMVSMSTHGINTTQIEGERIAGKFDMVQPDLIIYMAGVNDTAAGRTAPDIAARAAITIANYQKFITWKQQRYPRVKLLMCSPTPVADTVREPQVVTLRTGMQNAVTTANDPLVKYLNFGDVWTATDPTYYVESGTAGLHPNVPGNLKMYTDKFKPFFDSNWQTI